MVFNSYIFVLLFLPLSIIGYFLLNKLKGDLSKAYLLVMSLWFYGYFNIKYLPIILISIIFNFIVYKLFCLQEDTFSKKFFISLQTFRRIVLVVALVFNIGILFYFKYFNFFVENINVVFGTSFVFEKLLLPLGISFFTFQQMSFVIDSFKKEVPKYNFLNYALFVTYFPQLIAGPIVTHDELVPQFADPTKRKFNWDNFSKGLYIFALGMAKKVLIADVFGNAANWGFANIALLDTTNAVIVMLAYTIQIYFDFSGYCDMAIGIGKMMNITLPINFNSPYKAITITDFWDRWHMTLTRFFTRYIYISLGGSRKGNARTYINTMVVFLASGLWHGANWTFVIWGALHGAFCVLTKWQKRFFTWLNPVVSWAITFIFVNLTLILFRANTITETFSFYKKIASFKFGAIDINISSCFNVIEFKMVSSFLSRFIGIDLVQTFPYILLVVFFVVVVAAMLFAKNAYEKMKIFTPKVSTSLTTVVLLVWAIVSFSGVSTFLYFNF